MVGESGFTGTVSERLQRQALGWWILGLVFLGVIAWIASSYLSWIVLGLFTYYVGRPITRRLQRYISSRSLAAGLALLFIVIPILLFVAAFLSVALGQALQYLSSGAVQTALAKLPLPSTGLPTDPVDTIVVILQNPTVSSALGEFGVVIGAFASTLFNLFLMLIFAFFLLVEDDRLARWFETNVLGADSQATTYLRSVDGGLTSVYFGYTLTIFVIMILAAVIYIVFNAIAPGRLTIPSAMLLAVITGVFTLIPLVGRSIVYAFIVVLLAIQALGNNPGLLWVPAVFFLFMVLVFDNVVRTYIRPYLSGKTYNMGLVMFAYLLGPALFGWYGIFMGPLLMVLIVQFIVRILPRLATVTASESDASAEPLGVEEGGGESIDDDSAETDSGASPSE